MAPTNDDEMVIGPNETALVAEVGGGLRLILPKYEDDDDVPAMARLLVAVIRKLEDEQWLEETMAALDDWK